MTNKKKIKKVKTVEIIEKDAIQRFLISGLGALVPILLFLYRSDINTIFVSVTFIAVLGYLIRTISLFIMGGLVGWFQDEHNPKKLFQLGIVAPTIITLMLSPANVQKKYIDSKSNAPSNVVGSVLSILSSDLYAGDAEDDTQQKIQELQEQIRELKEKKTYDVEIKDPSTETSFVTKLGNAVVSKSTIIYFNVIFLSYTIPHAIEWRDYLQETYYIKVDIYKYKSYDEALKKWNTYYAVVVNKTYDYNNALEWKEWALKDKLKDTFIWKYSD